MFFLTYIKKRVTMERIAIIKYYIVTFSSNSSNIWSKSTKKKAKQIVSTFKSIYVRRSKQEGGEKLTLGL